MAPSRLLAFAALAAGGCSSYLGSARPFDPASMAGDSGWRTAPNLAAIGQEGRTDCGPAALAMLLAAWDDPVSPEDIAAEAGCPEDGVRAGDLRDFARRRGFRAYLIDAGIEDLERELGRGRPVLVGLVQPHVGGARSHYVLVAAIHPERRRVVELDPAEGWRSDDVDGFLSEWTPAGRLALVVFRPAEEEEWRTP